MTDDYLLPSKKWLGLNMNDRVDIFENSFIA